MSSRGRVPPKVLVVSSRAPASAYAACAARTASGFSRFQSSPGRTVLEAGVLEQRAHAAVEQHRTVRAQQRREPVHRPSPSR